MRTLTCYDCCAYRIILVVESGDENYKEKKRIAVNATNNIMYHTVTERHCTDLDSSGDHKLFWIFLLRIKTFQRVLISNVFITNLNKIMLLVILVSIKKIKADLWERLARSRQPSTYRQVRKITLAIYRHVPQILWSPPERIVTQIKRAVNSTSRELQRVPWHWLCFVSTLTSHS